MPQKRKRPPLRPPPTQTLASTRSRRSVYRYQRQDTAGDTCVAASAFAFASADGLAQHGQGNTVAEAATATHGVVVPSGEEGVEQSVSSSSSSSSSEDAASTDVSAAFKESSRSELKYVGTETVDCDPSVLKKARLDTSASVSVAASNTLTLASTRSRRSVYQSKNRDAASVSVSVPNQSFNNSQPEMEGIATAAAAAAGSDMEMEIETFTCDLPGAPEEPKSGAAQHSTEGISTGGGRDLGAPSAPKRSRRDVANSAPLTLNFRRSGECESSSVSQPESQGDSVNGAISGEDEPHSKASNNVECEVENDEEDRPSPAKRPRVAQTPSERSLSIQDQDPLVDAPPTRTRTNTSQVKETESQSEAPETGRVYRTTTARPRARRSVSARKPRSQTKRQSTAQSRSGSSENDLSSGTHTELEIEIPEILHSQPYSGRRKPRTQLALSLPPLYKLSDIYKSITDRAIQLGIDEVLRHLGGKPLRVVTACSGTESPLLSLELVKENLQKHFGRDLPFKHLFSAEIVPFKQAYIERNFHPRFIFRDVAELKNRVAQTAYGSVEKIPKNVDILIAGFACVDFSGLNNHRKSLDEEGESGDTFWGLVRYAMTYRPRLVILENIRNAPWVKIGQHWNEIDYVAVHSNVDTKAYYLPQTRERGYMFCIDKRLLAKNGLSENDARQWKEVLAQFKRPASSPAGMFLLSADDRRLEQIEKDTAMKINAPKAAPRKAVDWAKYQGRHQTYRLHNGLGYRRPVTKSQDDGTCRLPDFAWQTHGGAYPERVWDTLDVNYLRKLKDGCDMNYKERCIELSQGVDREIDSRAYGIVGCLTPTGMPYLTTRGGPLCGLEALALQGLPLDRLLLTQESQKELQDLAGNAMTSTVVGAAILSALIVGYKVIEPGGGFPASRPKTPKRKSIIPRDGDSLIVSSIYLESSEMDTVWNFPAFRDDAASSARHCMCERQSSLKETISRCKLCSHTACADCKGNPKHDYEDCLNLRRILPLDFASKLRGKMPARLVVRGISRADYTKLQCEQSTDHGIADVWDEFLDAVFRAVGEELRFLAVKRSEVWTVLYEGKSSILKLIVEHSSVTWYFFAKPRESDPALCLIREILSKPIARMVVSEGKSILDGSWEICAPISSACSLQSFGCGSRVQCYEASCGLEGYDDAKVWSHITVQGADEEVENLELDVRGTYELLPECGTANGSLHKRPATEDKPEMYLFLDPTKLGELKNDPFVFSLEHRRNPGYDARLTIGEVSHRWRSSKVTEEAELMKVFYRKWVTAEKAYLSSYPGDGSSPITFRSLDPDMTVSISSNSGCHNSHMTVVSATASVEVLNSPETSEWEVINPIDSPDLVQEYAWLLQNAGEHAGFGKWREARAEALLRCTVCVPVKPRIIWGQDQKGSVKAYEDPYDAALYERQVKARPSAFLIFRRTHEQGSGELRVTLNVQSLLHQAFQRLVHPAAERTSFYWRIVPDPYNFRDLTFPQFELKSNREDPQWSQPPGFLLNLRPEQLRSLTWMITQEAEDIEPFVEEETEEALLSSLMWHAECRVTVSKTIRGGILADDVGYGKTAIVLGLIDTQSAVSQIDLPRPLNDGGYITSRATLIVVPNIMLHQWQSEIAKFLGDKYKVLVFQSARALAKASIADVRDCDIILVSWAVFNTQSYYQRVHHFAGAPQVPEKTGRYFDQWFHNAHDLTREQARVLVEHGRDAFIDHLNVRLSKVSEEEDYTYVPSKRLRGKKHEQANRKSKKSILYVEISDEEPSDASDEEDPEILRARVGRHLKLAPPMPLFDTETQQKDQTGKKTESEEGSQAESKTQNKEPTDGGIFYIHRKGMSQTWDSVTAPPLHAFAFTRLVIDEFTYTDTDRLVALTTLQARSRWVLSGTPPLNDFADVNTIAPFLRVHLGIVDPETLSQDKRHKINRERSDAENFQAFQAPRSEAWHRRRHQLAQVFLDRFARRNVPEIDEIPFTEHIVLVPQSPAEIVIYLELFKQLMAYNKQLCRSRGLFASDYSERLDEIIGCSSSAEEALIKRSSSLALQGRWDKDGRPEAATCESLILNREGQLANLKDGLKDRLKLAAWLYCGHGRKHEKFDKFMQSVIRHDFGDMTVTNEAYPLLTAAIRDSRDEDWKLFFSSEDDPSNPLEGEAEPKPARTKTTRANTKTKGKDKGKGKTKGKGKAKGKAKAEAQAEAQAEEEDNLPPKPTGMQEFERMLREVTSAIRSLIVEWVLRQRALRFLRAVNHIQNSPHDIPPCNRCESQPDAISRVNILGSCGHTICADCVPRTLEKEECPIPGCRGSGKSFNIISVSSLGIKHCNVSTSNTEHRDKSSVYGGTKLDTLVDILNTRVPPNERALLFIQFPDLMEVASKALCLAGIKHIIISTADKGKKSIKKIEEFQNAGGFAENRVLILNLGTEMAAGLNLQCANHIFFLSPLHAQTQYDYDSSMVQAIGRSRRYGQTRHVHIYHLLAKKTIDVNIFQERRGKVLVERNGEAVLVPAEEALDSEKISCQGPDLVVDNSF